MSHANNHDVSLVYLQAARGVVTFYIATEMSLMGSLIRAYQSTGIRSLLWLAHGTGRSYLILVI